MQFTVLSFMPLAVEVSHRRRSRLATRPRRHPLHGPCHALPICVAMWEERLLCRGHISSDAKSGLGNW